MPDVKSEFPQGTAHSTVNPHTHTVREVGFFIILKMLSFCKCSVVLTEREYKQSCVVQQLHKTRYTHTFMSCSTRKKPSSLKSTSLKSTIRSSTQSRSLSRGFSRTAGTYTQTDECSDMNVTLLRVQIASSRRNSHFPLVLGHTSCQ